MKLWIDDMRPAPEGYISFKGVNEALRFIVANRADIEVISLDHDSGDYHKYGGDYIRILDELERLSRKQTTEGLIWRMCLHNVIKFHLHSANPVGVANMRRIIERNGWEEVK